MTTEAIGLPVVSELSDSKSVAESSSEKLCNINDLNSSSTGALLSNDSSKINIGASDFKGKVDIDISHDPSDCIDSNIKSELSVAVGNGEKVRIDLEAIPLTELDDQSKILLLPKESEFEMNKNDDTPEICVPQNAVEIPTNSEHEAGDFETEKYLFKNDTVESEKNLLKDDEEIVPLGDLPDSSDIQFVDNDPEINEDAVENNDIEEKEAIAEKEHFDIDNEEEIPDCGEAQRDETLSETDHVHEKEVLPENSDTSINIKPIPKEQNINPDNELQVEKDDKTLTKECVESFEDKLGKIDISNCETVNKDPISCEEERSVNENLNDECMETEETFQTEAVDDCMDAEGLEADVHMEEELLEGKDTLVPGDLPVVYDAELEMCEGDDNKKLNLAVDDVHLDKNVDVVLRLGEKVAAILPLDEKVAAILPTNEKVDVALPLDNKVEVVMPLDDKVAEVVSSDEKIIEGQPSDEKVDVALPLDEKVDVALPLDEKVDVVLPLDEKVDEKLHLDENSPLNEEADPDKLEAEQPEDGLLRIKQPTDDLPKNDDPVDLPKAVLLDEDFPEDEELDDVLKDEPLHEDMLKDDELDEELLKHEQLDEDVLEDKPLVEDVHNNEQTGQDIPEVELEDFQKEECLDGYLGFKSNRQQTENVPSKIHEEISDKTTEENSLVEKSSAEDEVPMDISKNDIEPECAEDQPEIDCSLQEKSPQIFTSEINMEVGADGLQTDSDLPMEDNSILEDSVQPDDIVTVKDGQSIITSLVDYPSDSEDLSVKNNEPEFEIPKSPAVVVHTPCFEEDAQSSWSIDTAKVPPLKIKQLATTIDEDSRASSVSQKSATKRPHSDDEALPVFTAEQMFEYRWPADGGEFYLVQEHVSEFLGVKSFKRKYPDCTRRPADVTEKRYLKEKGVVSETQCDLGLTAIRTDDVLELMSKDYPEKYQEYIRVLQERERQKINSKNKEYSTPSIDKNKMNDFVQKAMKATAEFNMHLNQERREERRTSFDMQTFTIHVPANKILKLSKEATKVGKYPVALLPGQFQDYYRPYTSQELKYFPINTVLYGPLKELSTVYTQPSSDGSQSDSEDSCASEGSCCSSSQGTHDSADSSSGSESAPKVKTENPELHVPTLRIKDRLASTCKVCHGTHERNKEGYSEDLIHCSECGSSGHPSCLDITAEMCETIRTYSWQCMDCKTCMLCMDPYDEDKMMFCDKCDRGYHTFCVGLKNLPNGRWICQLCGQCSGCGARAPGPEGSKAQWQQDSSKNAADKKPQLLCLACAKPSKR